MCRQVWYIYIYIYTYIYIYIHIYIYIYILYIYIYILFSLIPFKWFEHPKIFFRHYSHEYFLLKLNEIVCKCFRNKNISKDTNHKYPFINWSIFWRSAPIAGEFWVSLNHPLTNFQKRVCPKTVSMWHSLYI